MTEEILDPNKEIKNPKFNTGDGVSICSWFTGYGANKMGPSAIMLKSQNIDITDSVALRKAYRQVRVSMSMEEFLKKFFGLWHEDAKVLASVLGYEVESDEYESDHYRDMIKEKVDSIELMKSLKSEEDFFKLDNGAQDKLIALQAKFEKGLRSGAISESSDEGKTSIIVNEENSENGEDMSEIAELKKMLEDERAARKADKEAAEKDVILMKASDISFLEETSVEMLKAKDVQTVTEVMAVMMKANEQINELKAKNAELENKVKAAEDTLMNKSLSVDGEADDSKTGGVTAALKKMNQYIEGKK